MQGTGTRMAASAAALLTALLTGSQAFAGSAMATGGLTSQPIGHYEFCQANPRECEIRPRDRGPEKLTGHLWRRIKAVNVSVNRAVAPMNDFDLFGKDEVWTYPDGAGDCEDYVLEKRRLLSRAGVSLANLLITVVRKADGEGHAVLTVRTDKGDYILDNLTDKVRSWNETGYRFLKRQASNNTGRWVTLKTGSSTVVGALK